jgi:hypothetical protein
VLGTHLYVPRVEEEAAAAADDRVRTRVAPATVADWLRCAELAFVVHREVAPPAAPAPAVNRAALARAGRHPMLPLDVDVTAAGAPRTHTRAVGADIARRLFYDRRALGLCEPQRSQSGVVRCCCRAEGVKMKEMKHDWRPF